MCTLPARTSTLAIAITCTTPTGGSTATEHSIQSACCNFDCGAGKSENAPIQRLNWEHTFSDKMTNHLTLGYLNRNEGYYSLNAGAALPFVPGVANTTFLPEFQFGGGYTQLGDTKGPSSKANLTTRGTYAFNDVLTRVFGRHTVTAGYEWHLAGTSIHNGSKNQGGTFSFNANTTGNTTCASNTPCPGDAMASFYLGAAAQSNVQYYNVTAEYPRQSAYAAHVGDSWRMSPKLTVNYSIRWDYISPFKEKFNNLSFFDPTGLNPGAVTSGGTHLPGRLAFAGNGFGSASYGAPYPETPFKKGFAPRAGFAYSVNDKTVVRAGYGIYFGQAFYPGWSGGMSQDGFNKDLILNQSASAGNETPAIYLSSGITTAQIGSTSNLSATADNGNTPSLYRPLDGNRRPYSSQWNLTIERQLPSNFYVGISYVGTKGTHLPSALSPLNVLNPNIPSIASLGSHLADTFTASTTTLDGVSQPYVGWASQMTGCAPTSSAGAVAVSDVLRNAAWGLNEEHATSMYNSFQAHVERHMRHGLYALGSLTLQKLYTNGSDTTQSTNDTGSGNQGNNGQFSPFNEGRSLDHRARQRSRDGIGGSRLRPANREGQAVPQPGWDAQCADWRGWQVDPIFRYEFGTPFLLQLVQLPHSEHRIPVPRGMRPWKFFLANKVLMHGRNGFDPSKNGGRYLNPAAFETNFSSFGYTGYGKAVTTVYGPSFKNTDIALNKNFQITERASFKFTVNFFNAFNNHALINSQGGNYGGPAVAFVTDVAASGNSFGTWNGATSSPRTIQFAGRIQF